MTTRAWKLPTGLYKADVGRFAGDVVLTGNAKLSASQLHP
jgi:hypothetical protein